MEILKDLSELTVKELKSILKKEGITIPRGAKEADLISLLEIEIEAQLEEIEDIAEEDASIGSIEVDVLDIPTEKIKEKIEEIRQEVQEVQEISVQEKIYNYCIGTNYDPKDPTTANAIKKILGL